MLGDILPCCDSSTDFPTAIFSNTCSYCTSGQQTANQALMTNPNNIGNSSGVPNCDPNAGFFSNLFSNNCNVNNVVGSAIGLPSIPDWAWLAGGGLIAFLLLKNSMK